MNIAVVGGTSFDSGRGAVFLKAQGIESTPIGLSAHPDEQTALYQSPDKVKQRFAERVQPQNFDQVVIYCNSLSFISDWSSLYPGKVWELSRFYQALLEKAERSKMAIWVAENSMKANLTRLLKNQGYYKQMGIQVMPKLALIKQLEKADTGTQNALITRELDKLKEEGYEEVVFGCTHFDHPDLYKYRGLAIYQPGLEMLQAFMRTQGAM